jgi:hypothetical protein
MANELVFLHDAYALFDDIAKDDVDDNDDDA